MEEIVVGKEEFTIAPLTLDKFGRHSKDVLIAFLSAVYDIFSKCSCHGQFLLEK